MPQHAHEDSTLERESVFGLNAVVATIPPQSEHGIAVEIIDVESDVDLDYAIELYVAFVLERHGYPMPLSARSAA